MDASKLFNILSDLNFDSNNKNIADALNELISNISVGNDTAITDSFESLKKKLSVSVVNNYSPSNIKILEEIGGARFVGNNAIDNLQDILYNSSYNVQKTISDLQKYSEDRALFMNNINDAHKSLKSLNVDAHYYSDATFEIGLLLPESLTENKVINVTKELNKWDKVLKTIKEITEGTVEDTELTLVSNGSLQFFIENSHHVAVCLIVIVERVVKIYKTIIEIREARERLKELGIAASEQKNIEKQEKELYNKEIDKVVADIIKDYALKGIESGRLNELKVALKGHIIYIIKCIDNGIVIEVTPPEIDEEEYKKNDDGKGSDDNDAIKKVPYNLMLKKIEVVQKSMDLVKSIGRTGLDITKLLSSNDVKEDNGEEE
ncbi:hypothetical protein LJ707_19300 [Mucilaginibacter sp. UR6-1]|uniref:hypothetical protein n=1 Tax=Mucilaginibacter sp. UR6-1 TaxID=1435643 RepID=UPI001E3915C9|nr:hypothetical protein [Mucilaginibacter sp. UR6-1]MCC8411096.1 hypothetical protein [Mucilaginibacter sp. UR6-1]